MKPRASRLSVELTPPRYVLEPHLAQAVDADRPEDQQSEHDLDKERIDRKITSAWVMIATITTPKKVPKTLTWPPLSAAPPMTGAANERINQSSPIEG